MGQICGMTSEHPETTRRSKGISVDFRERHEAFGRGKEMASSCTALGHATPPVFISACGKSKKQRIKGLDCSLENEENLGLLTDNRLGKE